MKKTKNITIVDDGTELKFKITQLSALGLQRWSIDAGVALAETGLLELDMGEISNGISFDDVIRAIARNGFSFLGKLNSDKANELLIRLICSSTVKLSGASIIQMTETELDNTFSDIKALIELEKEVFLINFHSMLAGSQLNIPELSNQMQNSSDAPISIKHSHP